MKKRNNLIIFILTVGVFGILNTEMGIIGILPFVAEKFQVSISQAGLLVSLFALVVAISGPTMPLLFSGIDRKKVMLLVLGIFTAGNIVAIFAPNFVIALLARVIPAFFHPIYCSLAFSVAAASVKPEESPKAVAKVFIGVSAGMVIGVPVSNFIAAAVSLEMSMAFFALVTALALLATFFWVPSMPVERRLSYGEQVSVLKKSLTWISLIAVLLMNGAVFGVFSYLAKYLESVTHFSWNTISLVLFVYGMANILGSMLAGRLLTKNANKTVAAFPFFLGALYMLLFLVGEFAMPAALLIFIWGVLGGIGANINQYWVSTAAPEAPDFANGLFLTSANLGVTLGATVCGYFISEIGMEFVMLGGVVFSALSSVFIFMRLCRSQRDEKMTTEEAGEKSLA
ncbi:MFS transporter [Succinispira mobilis]|uniref:MFS transporter n=1 Tax=Succinispira mobilis TaxID=78120 RepID=UPI00037A8321|nr:MFS transporter [Succinispira mobilis]